jgi:APA family basic amino acid/polyamine antiporter
MFSLDVDNWIRLVVWLAIGFAIYFLYSRHHSVLQRTGHSQHHVALPSEPTYTEPEDDDR